MTMRNTTMGGVIQVLLGMMTMVQGQTVPIWTAYNDLYTGPGTGNHTTAWNEFGTLDGAPGNSGRLTNSVTGGALPVTLTITSSGSIGQGTTSGAPDPGTPAYQLFDGFIDWSSGPEPTAPQINPGAEVDYVFTGLDSSRRYSFAGASVRGGSGSSYALRWTLIELSGAASFVPAHTTGAAAYTNGLPATQVAINTGVNAATGDYAAWENIDPGADGAIAVRCTYYGGSIPGGTATGSYGYALMALRLREFDFTPSPAAIGVQPTNQSVLELSAAAFLVGVKGNPPPAIHWYRGDQAIPDATNATYVLTEAALADDGALFQAVARNLVSNRTYTATSSPAMLRVKADTTAPALISATTMGLGQVQAAFSKPLDATSASALTHYLITNRNGALPILGASLDGTRTNVVLQVGTMSENGVYTLVVNGVTDRTAAHNSVAPNSLATFAAVTYQPHDIGGLTPAGILAPVAGGYDITAGGTDIGGASDQFFLSSLPQMGDFDLETRLQGFDTADAWAKAGLIARESANANSGFVAILATSANVGVFLESRSATGAAASLAGSFPVNYPNTWLRLQRVGNRFTGYASLDGKNWVPTGSTTLALASTLQVGFAVCGHGQAATARFRDFGPGTGAVSSAVALPFEPLGLSSRLTSLVFSEIMYAPLPAGTNELEYVELYNTFGTPADISGYRLSGDIDFTFPARTILPANSFLVVARNPGDVRSVYGLANVLGPFTGALSKSGGTLRLRHRTGAVFLEMNYGGGAPWPVAANGFGHSLVLARPSFGENDPRAWAASDRIGGSPGQAESYGQEPLRAVLVNEILARPEASPSGYVELYNHSNEPVDLAGAWLSNDKKDWAGGASPAGYLIPANTVIPARGFLAFEEGQLGFGLDAAGGAVFLVNSNRTRIIDALVYAGQELGVAWGRYPDGASDVYALQSGTPGAANRGPFERAIVINEIMCDPISGTSADQYVELYNRGAAAIDVGGWGFTRGIQFQIPKGTVMPPDGYLVVAKNAANLRARYPGILDGKNTVGDFSGTLARGGETLVLSAPQAVAGTNRHGVAITNTIWIDLDEVTYGTGGRWGTWAGGGGSSLEAINPRADRRRPGDWADSDETAKAPWTTVSYAGKLDNGDVAADSLQVLLQGPGECLIDDVEVLNASGANQVANSTFESGAGGWVAEGTHDGSGLETTGGFNGGQCYHVRAVERGDNQINRIRTTLKTPLAAGTTGTIRAKVRWLKGHPEILFRLRGKWLEAVGEMTLPPQPGTPGTRNSRAVAKAPPAIFAVAHSPVLPAAGEAAIVTARISDPDGVGEVTLNYRMDPATTVRTLVMVDDGTGGDAVAGDGLYTATIPGQTAGTLVAFHIRAAAGQTPPTIATFPSDAPTRECLVRYGEPVQPGNMPVYRLWITQAAFSTWSNRPKLNNTPLDFTFVLGNQRVIYNAKGLFAGSPYISGGYSTPAGNRCGYSISLPDDDAFLGGSALVLDWPGGHGNENTAMQEQMAYWLADRLDLPHCFRYYIRLIVNGVTDMQRGGVFEAINQPGRDFVKAWSPDDADGDLYKIERGYEFSDGGGLTADPMPRLGDYTTTGGAKKTARYRWNWLKRAYRSANDFTNIFNLVDAVNAAGPEPLTSRTTGLADIEEWMRLFAFEHIVNNFDSWGHEIAKNMFAYKPQNGKWRLYAIDMDWLMLVSPLHSSSQYGNGNGPLFLCEDPAVARLYANPPFARAYYRAVQDAVDGPLASANCDPVMDAKYQWLTANGITLCDGSQLAAPTQVKKWFSDRRRVLLTQLAQVAADFQVTASSAAVGSSNLVTLTGTAPIALKTLDVNGVAYEPVWTSVSGFTLRVPLAVVGTNRLVIQGRDLRGQAVANAGATLSVVYQGPAVSPVGLVVFNEIGYNPAVPGASFVELYNASAQAAFDVSGWRIDGLNYTFPAGTVFPPRTYRVLARDREAFLAAYPGIAPDDVFAGNLAFGGETLALIQPGATKADDLTVNAVRYEAAPPWPAAAPGSSLQLIDPERDNRRAANWAARATAPLATPGAANSTAAALLAFPPLWLNEVQAENPGVITDRLGEKDPWIELYNAGSEAISLADFYLADNYTNLAGCAFPANSLILPHEFKTVFADGQPLQSTEAEWHTSFRLVAGTGSIVLSRLSQGRPQVLDYLNYQGLKAGYSYGSLPDGQPLVREGCYYATPGGTNNGAPAPLAVFINEWLASNTKTIVNPATGHYDDWFELYNAGEAAADLAGYYLSGDLTNPNKFRIPSGYVIPASGFLLVWADNAEGNNDPSDPDLHTNFKLAAGGDAIGLFAGDGSALDTVSFGPQTSDVSSGRSPDGGAVQTVLATPTPRASNLAAAPRFLEVALTAEGEVTLTWSAQRSLVYQVQFTDDLSAGSWSNLGPAITATAASMAARDSRTGLSHRFYRVTLAGP